MDSVKAWQRFNRLNHIPKDKIPKYPLRGWPVEAWILGNISENVRSINREMKWIVTHYWLDDKSYLLVQYDYLKEKRLDQFNKLVRDNFGFLEEKIQEVISQVHAPEDYKYWYNNICLFYFMRDHSMIRTIFNKLITPKFSTARKEFNRLLKKNKIKRDPNKHRLDHNESEKKRMRNKRAKETSVERDLRLKKQSEQKQRSRAKLAAEAIKYRSEGKECVDWSEFFK